MTVYTLYKISINDDFQLEDIKKDKRIAEDRGLKLKKEKADLSSQLEENEEELQEVIAKYKASVSSVSADQMTI